MLKKIFISVLVILFISLIYIFKEKPLPQQEQQQELESTTPNNEVPPLLEEDIISLFFNLIDEGRIPEAVDMLSENSAPDNSAKQAWGVQFNAIKSINVLDIQVANKQSWTESEHMYEVKLEAYVSSEAENAPIPYYGWHDNPNIRWITLVKEENVWKIDSLATGM